MSGANGHAVLSERTAQHDPDAERAVLGAMMFAAANGGGLEMVSPILGALHGSADFYDPRHRLIYEKIAGLAHAGLEPHPITVLAEMTPDELRRTDNGTYVTDCAAVGNPAQGTYYASQVRKWAALRSVRTYAARVGQAVTTVAAADVDEVIARIQDEAGKLQAGGIGTSYVDHDRTSTEVMDMVEQLGSDDDAAVVGAQSGWVDVDKLLNGGLKPGQLAVMAGRPGLGKTTGAVCWAYNVAIRQKRPVLFHSLEMSRLEVGTCVVSAGAKIPKDVLDSGQLSVEEWTRFARFLAETEGAPLYYDDTAGVTLADIEAGIRVKQAQLGPLGLVVIDQLNLIQSSARAASREQEISEMSRRIKVMAKQYEVPILLLHQLNRGPEQRQDKRPQLSDLRDSGQVEANADIVILLHRDDYYDPESPRAGEVDLIVAKHRGGRTDTLTLASQLHLARFVSMAVD